MGDNGRFDVSGRVALVTGSTRGLGNVMARGLGDVGAGIVINGRSQDAVDDVVRELVGLGIDAHGVAFDVTDEAAVESGISRIELQVGPIDILVNNAGIQDRAPLEQFDAGRFRRLIDINLTAPFIVAKACAMRMIDRGRGNIINICSLMSETGRATIGPYTASKGGLKMLTKSMAVDWARYGIRVNGIGPGYFATEMTEALVRNPGFNAWVVGRTPTGRWGAPDELVGPLIFLASDAASFVHGQILYVDGGMLSVL